MSLTDRFCGAGVDACSAFGALAFVDNCDVVPHADGLSRTGIHALLATRAFVCVDFRDSHLFLHIKLIAVSNAFSMRCG